jgi:hypothetical protein
MLIKLASLFYLASTITLAVAAVVPKTKALQKRIPAAVYPAGNYGLYAQGTPIAVLDNGVTVDFQISDSNLVVYLNGVAQWDSGVTIAGGCYSNQCILDFQSDGNLVSYYGATATWNTGTGGGQGAWLVFFDVEPYIVIYNSAYEPIWHTPTPSPPPVPSQSYDPDCDDDDCGDPDVGDGDDCDDDDC